MEPLLKELAETLDGEIETADEVRLRFSHDASIYQMLPHAVMYPRDSNDIKRLVNFATRYKQSVPSLALTPRGAGTDMTGAAIGNSLVLGMTRHFTNAQLAADGTLHTQPGVFVSEIEPQLDQTQRFIGSLPASRQWCTFGGMVGNNAGGEQSLRYGNTENFVQELQVVLADGNEYTLGPLTKRQLQQKMQLKTFEGDVYRKLYALIEKDYEFIRNARPKVSKNSMGYNLWSVWDREKGIFNLAPLFTGSQGTLGIITDITLQTLPKASHTGVLILYLSAKQPVGEIIATVVRQHPAVFEGFDDITFELGMKHFNLFKKQLGTKEWLKQQASLFSSVTRLQGHLPSMVLMVEFDGASQTIVDQKITKLQQALAPFKLRSEVAGSEEESSRFWQIRRASFQLLRERIHGKYAAPFIDDLVVQPKHLPQFLPQLRKIIRKHNLPATIAGHFGDGNLHIIPLIDIKDPAEQLKLEPVLREIVPLVLQYGGTLAGEHNDGMIRGPWLPAVFGNEMYQIFRQTKEIFDPLYIFNPHKKTDADWDFSMKHIRTTNR